MPLLKLPRLKKKDPAKKADKDTQKKKKAKKSEETSAKRKINFKRLLPVALILVAVIVAVATLLPRVLNGVGIGFGSDIADFDMLDTAVSKALLSDENAEVYNGGECPAEGHTIMGVAKTEDGKIKAYTLTMTGFYGFIDSNFVKTSGSGMIPAVFTFEDGKKQYKLLSMEFPMSGSGFEPSIKEMFPEEYLDRVMEQSEKDIENLRTQERKYAEAYLQKIDRKSEIGDYADFDILLLSESGIPLEITNFIAQSKDLSLYPYWIGTREYVEDGTRYTYSTDFDKDRNSIIMKKYSPDTPDVPAEHIEIDSVTREMKIF